MEKFLRVSLRYVRKMFRKFVYSGEGRGGSFDALLATDTYNNANPKGSTCPVPAGGLAAPGLFCADDTMWGRNAVRVLIRSTPSHDVSDNVARLEGVRSTYRFGLSKAGMSSGGMYLSAILLRLCNGELQWYAVRIVSLSCGSGSFPAYAIHARFCTAFHVLLFIIVQI